MTSHQRASTPQHACASTNETFDPDGRCRNTASLEWSPTHATRSECESGHTRAARAQSPPERVRRKQDHANHARPHTAWGH
eukprot:5695831-Prymnesium_polylepis.1